MSHQKHLRLEGAGHRLRINYRGVPRRFRTELSRKQHLQLAIFLLAMIIVCIVAMYVSWWTAREEERDFPRSLIVDVSGCRAGVLTLPSRCIGDWVWQRTFPANITPVLARA
jgi:hypothetical protein